MITLVMEKDVVLDAVVVDFFGALNNIFAVWLGVRGQEVSLLGGFQ